MAPDNTEVVAEIAAAVGLDTPFDVRQLRLQLGGSYAKETGRSLSRQSVDITNYLKCMGDNAHQLLESLVGTTTHDGLQLQTRFVVVRKRD